MLIDFSFTKKIVKGMAAATFLNLELPNRLIRQISTFFNYDYKEMVVGLVRGFKVNPLEFLATF